MTVSPTLRLEWLLTVDVSATPRGAALFSPLPFIDLSLHFHCLYFTLTAFSRVCHTTVSTSRMRHACAIYIACPGVHATHRLRS